MKKKTSEMTIAELRARAAEIRTEVNAEGADLDALEAEADEISQRIAQYETEQRRLGIAQLRAGIGGIDSNRHGPPLKLFAIINASILPARADRKLAQLHVLVQSNLPPLRQPITGT